MLRVSVELISAVDGRRKELAEMFIWNDGTELRMDRGNYVAMTCDMRTKQIKRGTTIQDYPRLSKDVWHLVADALAGMKYEGN